MQTKHIAQLAQKLEIIFNKAAKKENDTLKVTLDTPITPDQSKELIIYCADFGAFPTITRSGAGLSVLFDVK